MKKLLIATAAIAIAFTACKKKDDAPSNSITIDGTTYNQGSTNSFLVSGSSVTVGGSNGSNGASVGFKFTGSSAPTAGTYRVIASGGTVGANQVSFIALTGNASGGTSYESTGTGTVDVTVTNNNGKLTVKLPAAPAKSGSTTVNVSATVAQQ